MVSNAPRPRPWMKRAARNELGEVAKAFHRVPAKLSTTDTTYTGRLP